MVLEVDMGEPETPDGAFIRELAENIIKFKKTIVDILAMSPMRRKFSITYQGVYKHPQFQALRKRMGEDHYFADEVVTALSNHPSIGPSLTASLMAAMVNA